MRLQSEYAKRIRAGATPVAVTSPEAAVATMVAAGFRRESFAARLTRACLRARGWSDPIRLGPGRVVVFVMEE